MTLVVVPTDQDFYAKLRELVIAVVPINVEVVQGLGNRAAMPVNPFVCMTATVLNPLHTPIESWDQNDPNPDAVSYLQGFSVLVQLDCYGPLSANWAAMLATILRTDYACQLFKLGGFDMAPLYADNPMQAALINGEEQYEQRWIVGSNLQYNPVVSTPMEFADTAEAVPINVDVRFPP